MSASIGLNEALILTAMASGDELGVVAIVARLEELEGQREIREATIYVALQRMTQRGFVTARKERVISRDGRARDVGIYRIATSGLKAAEQFARETAPMRRLFETLA